MNFFINQGRCRVCGKMLCCSTHQKEHERLDHKEYAYLLDKLPIICKKCYRTVYSVHDLHAKCHPFMDQRLMNGNFSDAVMLFNKPNRKRTLNGVKKMCEDPKPIVLSSNERKKLVPAYRLKHNVDIKKIMSDTKTSQQTFIIEVNRIFVDSKQSVFSPQLNASYGMLLSSIIKSSTPLNEEEKEIVPLAQDKISEKKENLRTSSPDEVSVYESPEKFQSIIISAKKNTPPGIISSFSKRISKKVLKNRRVTFELTKTTDSEGNFTIYGTPTATMEVIEEIDEQEELDLTIPNSPPRCLLLKFMKRMRNAIHSIPRTITTAWDWGNKRFKESQSNDEEYNFKIRSPLKKRPKYDTIDPLVRKPITSYWVDMSVNSLYRKPLPNYVHRFSESEVNCHL